MKHLILLLTSFFPILLSSQNAASLYLSRQTGEFSSLSGTGSKTTDQHENGTVTISHTGPIVWTVDPADFSIGTNETKTWSGTVQPDMATAPAPGLSAEATITGDYDVNYSRPAGTGSGGTVTSTYSCGDSCWYHPTGGMHEMVNMTGTIDHTLTVYSIKVTLPDTICLAKSQTANSASGDGTATPFPATGGSFRWTVLGGPITLANDQSQTATITLNDTTVVGKVRVKFTIEGVSYETDAFVKACDCQCKPVTNGETFGPLTVQFATPPLSTSPDAEGYCSYQAINASFTLKMQNPVEDEQAAVQNAKVTYRKHCKTGEFKDVTITWTGDIAIGSIKFIDANLKEISLTVATNGNLNGHVILAASLNQDKDLTGKNIMILRKGITGTFKFNFSGGANFTGSFDFLGVENINIDIVKTGTVIAQFKDGKLDSGGTLTGTFTAVGGAQYKTNLFTVTMGDLSLGLELSLTNGFKLLDGNGSVIISEMKGLQGVVKLTLEFNQGNCKATIELAGSNVTAFSMTLESLKVAATFNSDFDMIEFDGSLKAKHNSFDAAVEVQEFNVKDGELKKFAAKGKVKYSKFTFELISSTYAPVKLTISAKVELKVTGTVKLQVDKFTIDGDGTITVGGISGDFHKQPVDVTFSATFQTNRFKGSFNATFTSIGLDGKIDVGAEDTYNFGYFKLTAHANVPLGQSGLKLTQIGGEIGFNYQLNPSAGPSQGTYVIGLTLGVADVADFCEVVGNPVIQLGNSSVVMILNGSIAILKNNTFFTGNMNVNYKIPANTIDGSVSSTVKIPGSGFILTTNNVSVSFNIGGGSWSASGSNMGGSMFNGVVTFSQGNVSLNGSLSNPLALTGSLGGKASASFSQSVSLSALGNTLSGSLNVNMNSTVNAAINESGLSGSINVNVSGDGTLTFDTWVYSTTMQVSGNGNGDISVSGSSASMSGSMTVNLPFSIPFWGSQVTVSLSISI